MNKASGGDRILAKLFKILKDDAMKVLHSHARKFGKLSSSHRTGKGQFSFQSQRRSFFDWVVYFSGIELHKLLDSVDHNKLWKILKEVGVPEIYLSLEKSVSESRSSS